MAVAAAAAMVGQQLRERSTEARRRRREGWPQSAETNKHTHGTQTAQRKKRTKAARASNPSINQPINKVEVITARVNLRKQRVAVNTAVLPAPLNKPNKGPALLSVSPLQSST